MGELSPSLDGDYGSKPKIDSISVRMWCVAFIVALPSFLFGYIMAALNACLVTVLPTCHRILVDCSFVYTGRC